MIKALLLVLGLSLPAHAISVGGGGGGASAASTPFDPTGLAYTTATVRKVGDTMTGALVVAGASITASGPLGNIVSGASVTASEFFGSGQRLTGIPSTASISGVYAPLAGATFTGASGITNQAFTATGPNGNIVSGASITASAFFGNGSQLTNLPGEANTYASSKTFTATGTGFTVTSASGVFVASGAIALGSNAFFLGTSGERQLNVADYELVTHSVVSATGAFVYSQLNSTGSYRVVGTGRKATNSGFLQARFGAGGVSSTGADYILYWRCFPQSNPTVAATGSARNDNNNARCPIADSGQSYNMNAGDGIAFDYTFQTYVSSLGVSVAWMGNAIVDQGAGEKGYCYSTCVFNSTSTTTPLRTIQISNSADSTDMEVRLFKATRRP